MAETKHGAAVMAYGKGFVIAAQHASGQWTYWNARRKVWSHTDWYGARSNFHTREKAEKVLAKLPDESPFASDAKRLPAKHGNHGPCTPRQVACLEKRGFDTRTMTKGQATRIIEGIAIQEGWTQRPKTSARPVHCPPVALDQEYARIVADGSATPTELDVSGWT